MKAGDFQNPGKTRYARGAVTWILLMVCLSGSVAILLLALPKGAAGNSTSSFPLQAWRAYFRQEQYLADARTAVSMLRYLVEPEPGFSHTNAVVQS